MAESKKHVSTDGLGLYQWIANDLQRLRNELLREMRYSSVQVGSLYQEMKADKDKSASAISQEIRYSYKQNQTIYDGLASMLTSEVGDRLNAVDEKLTALAQLGVLLDEIREVKYGYQELQTAYGSLTSQISDEVAAKISEFAEKLSVLEQIEQTLVDLNGKLEYGEDYQKLAESINEKTEECVSAYGQQVLDAVAAVPVAENVDYERIVEEVGDKVLELLQQLKGEEKVEEVEKIDYDRIIYGAAEKVVESLPYPEKVDYDRIEASIAKAVSAIVIPEIDYDKLAEVVAAKVVVPEIDYDKLADTVLAKIADGTQQSYDVVLDDEGLAQIAQKVADRLNENKDTTAFESIEERLTGIEELLANSEDNSTYDLVLDEEGINAIAKSVSEEICHACATCEIPVAKTVEEVAEETVEEVVEEPAVEEVVEEVVEETIVEEPVVEEVVEEAVVEETPVEEELAVAEERVEEPIDMEELNNQLIDAETGLVIRLKKSFTAKMKQSEEYVKGYYSDLKNELTSYKRSIRA